jgi:predicted RNA-binding protein
MKIWICVGKPENWEAALSGNIWGVTEELKSSWETLEKDDILLFYATSPVRGIIGVGRVRNKFKQDKPLWPAEIKENKVIWPYRYEFLVEFALPRTEWDNKKIDITGLKIPTMRGLNPIKNLESVKLLFKKIDESWNTDFSKMLEVSASETQVIEINLHDELKEKILELGKIEGYIVEKEYMFPDINERLDAVWRRVAASVPTYVFEIQIGGNLHQALAKLKHAYDIWNSNIFLITTKDNLEKAQKLLSGSFHEIKNHIRILTVEKINEVYELQIKDNELKKELGFR